MTLTYAWDIGNKTLPRMCRLPHRAHNSIIICSSNFLDIRRIAIILYACDCDDMRNTFPSSNIEKCAFWEKLYVHWWMQHAWQQTKPEIDGHNPTNSATRCEFYRMACTYVRCWKDIGYVWTSKWYRTTSYYLEFQQKMMEKW